MVTEAVETMEITMTAGLTVVVPKEVHLIVEALQGEVLTEVLTVAVHQEEKDHPVQEMVLKVHHAGALHPCPVTAIMMIVDLTVVGPTVADQEEKDHRPVPEALQEVALTVADPIVVIPQEGEDHPVQETVHKAPHAEDLLPCPVQK